MRKIWKVAVSTIAGLVVLGGGFVAGRAWAGGVPSTAALTYSGTLEDATGAALTGSHNVQVNFWGAASGGTALCSTASAPIALSAGRFSVGLPDSCTASVKASPDVWSEVIVDGSSLGRTKIGAVPYSVEAGHATAADIASKGAANFSVAGDATVTGVLHAGVYISTNCKADTSGTVDDCACNSGEIAIGGGGYADDTFSPAQVALRESRNLSSNKAGPVSVWRVGCRDSSGTNVRCPFATHAVCARLAQ